MGRDPLTEHLQPGEILGASFTDPGWTPLFINAAGLVLEVGGLMSTSPVEEVAGRYDQLLAAARTLGSPLNDPFMAMSFMALEVIPSLKLTDHGLVDVEAFKVVDLFV